MSRTYVPAVGGWKFSHLLVDNRRRSKEVIAILGTLERAATTDATRGLLLQGKVMLLENLVEMEQLLRMAKGGAAQAGHAEGPCVD